jgi:hypothetical protein
MTIEISHWGKKEKKRKYESWETTNLQTKPSSKSLGVNTPRSTGKGKEKNTKLVMLRGRGTPMNTISFLSPSVQTTGARGERKACRDKNLREF